MEPMNATQTHSKVRITASLSAPVFVAGDEVSGKMEMDCRTDKGLGISTMMVELIAVQELTSRDHSATSTFMSAKRVYQGPGLPPSNAVFAHPQPGAPALPLNYYQARKGCTTFFFNFPLPQSSPNSINFGSGLARIFYEIRCSVSVFYKGERTTVRHNKEVIVTECLLESRIPKEPSTLVAEGGKMVVQAQVVGGIGVTGRSTCVELQVKNHSLKKTTNLSLTLTRTLHLPSVGTADNPFQIVDTVVTVPFRGSEYTISPGVEGVANLVFDVPRNARGVKGGTRELTGDGDHKHIEALFYVNTAITIAIGMGVGSKDLKIEVPVQILHPAAVPEPRPDPYQAAPYGIDYVQPPLEPPRPQYVFPPSSSSPPSPASYGTPPLQYQHTATQPYAAPYATQAPQISPIYGYPQHFVPPALSYSPLPPADQPYYYPPPPVQTVPADYLGRPTSAIPITSQSYNDTSPFTLPSLPSAPIAVHAGSTGAGAVVPVVGETEEGKGERASRISAHLRQSSRNRSASPTSHRYRMSGLLPASNALPIATTVPENSISTQALILTPPGPEIRSPRPMPSPKASYHGDPVASPGQSGRVAILERMVEEQEAAEIKTKEGQRAKEVENAQAISRSASPELSAAALNEVLDKELPLPPSPSLKPERDALNPKPLAEVFNSPPMVVEPTSAIREGELVQSIWAGEGIAKGQKDSPVKKEDTITILANLPKRSRHPRGDLPEEHTATPLADTNDSNSPVSAGRMTGPRIGGGLDALEKRLLKEVGTRKPSAAVLQQLRVMDNATDTAVKEKVEAKRKLGVEPHIKPAEDSEAATVAPTEDKEAAVHVLLNRKRRKTYDVNNATDTKGQEKRSNGPSKQEEEALRMRKEAKHRVADWLGSSQDAEPPPLSETRILEQPLDALKGAIAPKTAAILESIKADSKDSVRDKEKGSAGASKIQLPGRRSSGFLPMSRVPALPAPPTPESVDTGMKSNSPTVFPPLSPPKPGKYDVRSARGGRGGKVTSVAAIWAEKAKNNDSNAVAVSKFPNNRLPLPPMAKVGKEKAKVSPPISPTSPTNKGPLTSPVLAAFPKEEKQRDKTSNSPTEADKQMAWFKTGISTARSAPVNLVKGASVPAKLSSSIATPILSSTDSLARPRPKPLKTPSIDPKSPPVARPLKAIREVELPISVSSPAVATQPPATKPIPSVSFGQARLKDLIAKYQGGP